MSDGCIPNIFMLLLSDMCIDKHDIVKSSDGFFVIDKSIADILASKGIFDFPDSNGETLACNRFFDDWFLYAVAGEEDHTYSLLKLREQEHDAEDGTLADGDTPGATISFISFNSERLLDCLADPSDENRAKLSTEINRVVAYKGQSHHKALKKYFIKPEAMASYIVASMYVKHIAAFAENGYLEVPDYYKEIVQKSRCSKKTEKSARLSDFIEWLNESTCALICDQEKIYIKDKYNPTEYECLAILAMHTGNTSVYSFAAEVEYHAKFLTPLAKIKIPFFGRSIYDSAIRADMTIGDTEFEGPTPFYRTDSKIVKRHISLHKGYELCKGGN